MKTPLLAGALAVAGMAFGMSGTSFAAHSDHGCFNCHVPHKSGDATDPDAYGVPLWSNAQLLDGLPTFDLYTSASLDATDVGQPTGPSKLCLGCHDGSYQVFSFIPDSQAIFEAGDLASSHPVSFTYDTALATADGALHDPATVTSGLGGTIADDLLDAQGKMQCTSCHDVHTSGFGEYLLKYDIDAASEHEALLCRACHER
jgi:predicted CXXCH cytochrome family protein